jgi:hypothetical protein
MTILPLEPFRPDGEDMLAYERVLLHPFDRTLLEGYSDRPIAVADVESEKLDEWYETFRIVLGGRPKSLTERGLYGLAKKALHDGCFQFADDEDILRRSEL